LPPCSPLLGLGDRMSEKPSDEKIKRVRERLMREYDEAWQELGDREWEPPLSEAVNGVEKGDIESAYKND